MLITHSLFKAFSALRSGGSKMVIRFAGVVALLVVQLSSGFTTPATTASKYALSAMIDSNDDVPMSAPTVSNRRTFFSSVVASGMALIMSSSPARGEDEEEEGFSAIAARASKLAGEVGEKTPSRAIQTTDGRTAYDFSLPIQGELVTFKDVVHQEYDEEGKAKVKALLVVNMKEDDPVARKDIPEFISLATKYGRQGEFVVIMCPTDQGYFEPDTSALIRLKLASEYGYGLNPATVVTDKVNLLGTGAHPFWRWLQGNCRAPSGLGRIEGNFEKFLVDARTGIPLRRYPRKYKPYDIRNDIEAVVAGRPLPPAGANYLEEWRAAAVDMERDTYRFQKGLNYFDQ